MYYHSDYTSYTLNSYTNGIDCTWVVRGTSLQVQNFESETNSGFLDIWNHHDPTRVSQTTLSYTGSPQQSEFSLVNSTDGYFTIWWETTGTQTNFNPWTFFVRSAPVSQSVTSSPVSQPVTSSPVSQPVTSSPVFQPTSSPVFQPTSSPVLPPSPSPVVQTTSSPAVQPSRSPTVPACANLFTVSTFSDYTSYTLNSYTNGIDCTWVVRGTSLQVQNFESETNSGFLDIWNHHDPTRVSQTTLSYTGSPQQSEFSLVNSTDGYFTIWWETTGTQTNFNPWTFFVRSAPVSQSVTSSPVSQPVTSSPVSQPVTSSPVLPPSTSPIVQTTSSPVVQPSRSPTVPACANLFTVSTFSDYTSYTLSSYTNGIDCTWVVRGTSLQVQNFESETNSGFLDIWNHHDPTRVSQTTLSYTGSPQQSEFSLVNSTDGYFTIWWETTGTQTNFNPWTFFVRSAPVSQSVTSSPVSQPVTSSPVSQPVTSSPVFQPTSSPVFQPTSSPVLPPSPSPVVQTTSSPAVQPSRSPTVPACANLFTVSTFSDYTSYTLNSYTNGIDCTWVVRGTSLQVQNFESETNSGFLDIWNHHDPTRVSQTTLSYTGSPQQSEFSLVNSTDGYFTIWWETTGTQTNFNPWTFFVRSAPVSQSVTSSPVVQPSRSPTVPACANLFTVATLSDYTSYTLNSYTNGIDCTWVVRGTSLQVQNFESETNSGFLDIWNHHDPTRVSQTTLSYTGSPQQSEFSMITSTDGYFTIWWETTGTQTNFNPWTFFVTSSQPIPMPTPITASPVPVPTAISPTTMAPVSVHQVLSANSIFQLGGPQSYTPTVPFHENIVLNSAFGDVFRIRGSGNSTIICFKDPSGNFSATPPLMPWISANTTFPILPNQAQDSSYSIIIEEVDLDFFGCSTFNAPQTLIIRNVNITNILWFGGFLVANGNSTLILDNVNVRNGELGNNLPLAQQVLSIYHGINQFPSPPAGVDPEVFHTPWLANIKGNDSVVEIQNSNFAAIKVSQSLFNLAASNVDFRFIGNTVSDILGSFKGVLSSDTQCMCYDSSKCLFQPDTQFCSPSTPPVPWGYEAYASSLFFVTGIKTRFLVRNSVFSNVRGFKNAVLSYLAFSVDPAMSYFSPTESDCDIRLEGVVVRDFSFGLLDSLMNHTQDVSSAVPVIYLYGLRDTIHIDGFVLSGERSEAVNNDLADHVFLQQSSMSGVVRVNGLAVEDVNVTHIVLYKPPVFGSSGSDQSSHLLRGVRLTRVNPYIKGRTKLYTNGSFVFFFKAGTGQYDPTDGPKNITIEEAFLRDSAMGLVSFAQSLSREQLNTAIVVAIKNVHVAGRVRWPCISLKKAMFTLDPFNLTIENALFEGEQGMTGWQTEGSLIEVEGTIALTTLIGKNITVRNIVKNSNVLTSMLITLMPNSITTMRQGAVFLEQIQMENIQRLGIIYARGFKDLDVTVKDSRFHNISFQNPIVDFSGIQYEHNVLFENTHFEGITVTSSIFKWLHSPLVAPPNAVTKPIIFRNITYTRGSLLKARDSMTTEAKMPPSVCTAHITSEWMDAVAEIWNIEATRLSIGGHGGIATIERGAQLDMRHNVIRNVVVTGDGGVVHMWGESSKANLVNMTVSSVSARSGGISWLWKNTVLNISQGSSFSDFSTETFGGGIEGLGSSRVLIENSTLSSLQSGRGGGFSLGENAFVMMRASVLTGATAQGKGGFAFMEGSSKMYVSNSKLSQLAAGNAAVAMLENEAFLEMKETTVQQAHGDSVSAGLWLIEQSSTHLVGLHAEQCSLPAPTPQSSIALTRGFLLVGGTARAIASRCSFKSMEAASAVGCYGKGSLDISDSIFESNHGGLAGGALRLSTYGSVEIKRSIFTRNAATECGGAILYMDDGDGNNASSLMADNTRYILHDLRFFSNTAKKGGALCRAGLAFYPSLPVDIMNSHFENNTASGDAGGAAYLLGGKADIFNCSFLGNTAARTGGAVQLHSSFGANISNSNFTGNTARGDTTMTSASSRSFDSFAAGGALYISDANDSLSSSGSQAPPSGGGESAIVRITRTVFQGNIAQLGLGGSIYWNTLPSKPMMLPGNTFSGNHNGATNVGSRDGLTTSSTSSASSTTSISGDGTSIASGPYRLWWNVSSLRADSNSIWNSSAEVKLEDFYGQQMRLENLNVVHLVSPNARFSFGSQTFQDGAACFGQTCANAINSGGTTVVSGIPNTTTSIIATTIITWEGRDGVSRSYTLSTSTSELHINACRRGQTIGLRLCENCPAVALPGRSRHQLLWPDAIHARWVRIVSSPQQNGDVAPFKHTDILWSETGTYVLSRNKGAHYVSIVPSYVSRGGIFFAMLFVEGVENARVLEGTRQCLCVNGYFAKTSETDDLGNPETCYDCPPGALCSEDGNVDVNVTNKQGFWRDIWDSNVRFVKCPVPAACSEGGYDIRNRNGVSNSNSSSSSSSGDAQKCQEGYEGNLCTECAEGYGRLNEFECQKCPSSPLLNYLRIFGAFVLIVLVSLVLTSMNITASEDALFHERPTAASRRSKLTKIFLSAMQFVAIAGSFEFQWPPAIRSLLTVQAATGNAPQALLNVDCAMMNVNTGVQPFYIKCLILALVPLLIPVLAKLSLWMHARISALTACVFGEESEPESMGRREDTKGETGRESFSQPPTMDAMMIRKMNDGRYKTAAISLFFSLYPSITLQAFQLFKCRNFSGNNDPDGYLLIADMHERCHTGMHIAMLFSLGLPMVLCYVIGFPVLCAVLLRRGKDKIPNVLRKRGYLFTSKRDRIVVLLKSMPLFLLFNGYKGNYYLYEVVVLLRKVFIVAIAVFFEDKQVQALLAILLVVVSLCLHIRLQPYDNDEANFLDGAGMVTCFLTFFLGSFLYVDVSFEIMIMISFVILLANVLFISVSVWYILRTVLLGNKEEEEEEEEGGESMLDVVVAGSIVNNGYREEKANTDENDIGVRSYKGSDISDIPNARIIRRLSQRNMNIPQAFPDSSIQLPTITSLHERREKKKNKEKSKKNTAGPILYPAARSTVSIRSLVNADTISGREDVIQGEILPPPSQKRGVENVYRNKDTIEAHLAVAADVSISDSPDAMSSFLKNSSLNLSRLALRQQKANRSSFDEALDEKNVSSRDQERTDGQEPEDAASSITRNKSRFRPTQSLTIDRGGVSVANESISNMISDPLQGLVSGTKEGKISATFHQDSSSSSGSGQPALVQVDLMSSSSSSSGRSSRSSSSDSSHVL
eukprot:jgi/Bigna1/81959/fgenesh1_pg.86_\